MKAMKAAVRALPKGGIADALAAACEMKKAECSKVLDALADVGSAQVKSAGKFVIPGLVMIKTKRKKATGSQATDVWQRGQGFGEASEDCRQSLPRLGAQEVHLKRP